MGLLKKITRPISRVLDKIVPNEIKPALPFLAAAAPFMAPGIMGIGGNTMLSRALISGGLNLGSQLAQEGSEGDFSPLSVALASGIGALTAPGTAGYGTSDVMVEGAQPSAAEFFKTKAAGMEPGLTKSGLGALEKSANYLTGAAETLTNNPFSMEGLKASIVPVTQATTDLAVAEARRTAKDLADEALNSLPEGASDADRALAIRQFMEAAGYFSEDEIVDTITAAGYADGGRVGLKEGGDPEYGTEEYFKKNLDVLNLDELIEKPYLLNSFTIGLIEERINKYGEAGGDISPYLEKYKIAKQKNAEYFQSLNEEQQQDYLKRNREMLEKDLNMGIFPDQQNLGILSLEKETDSGNKIPAPKKDRFDIEGFKTYRMDAATGGRVGLRMGGDPDFSGIKGAMIAVDENMRADRAGDFFRLRDEAIQKGDDDKIKEIESDFFKEFGMVMPKTAKDGGLMDLGGKEMDLRKGGFVPIGKKERADDVPARLSKNEFVMTADAVRGAGGGDINKGAKRMYETMNRLEARA